MVLASVAVSPSPSVVRVVPAEAHQTVGENRQLVVERGRGHAFNGVVDLGKLGQRHHAGAVDREREHRVGDRIGDQVGGRAIDHAADIEQVDLRAVAVEAAVVAVGNACRQAERIAGDGAAGAVGAIDRRRGEQRTKVGGCGVAGGRIAVGLGILRGQQSGRIACGRERNRRAVVGEAHIAAEVDGLGVGCGVAVAVGGQGGALVAHQTVGENRQLVVERGRGHAFNGVVDLGKLGQRHHAGAVDREREHRVGDRIGDQVGGRAIDHAADIEQVDLRAVAVEAAVVAVGNACRQAERIAGDGAAGAVGAIDRRRGEQRTKVGGCGVAGGRIAVGLGILRGQQSGRIVVAE